MTQSPKADSFRKKPKDKDKNNGNGTKSKLSRHSKIDSYFQPDNKDQKNKSKLKLQRNSGGKGEWKSTFIYISPLVQEAISLNVFPSVLDQGVFKKMYHKAEDLKKKKEEQEAMELLPKSKSIKFCLGDLFPTSSFFKKKSKSSRSLGEKKLKVNLVSKEFHPYFGVSTKEEMKNHHDIKYQTNKFDDFIFNEKGKPPWSVDDENDISEESESETDTNLNIDSSVLVDLYKNRLKLVTIDNFGIYQLHPYKEDISSLSELDSFFKWENIVSNTVRSLVAIAVKKQDNNEQPEIDPCLNDKRVSFAALPTHYLAFNREFPFRKYVKIPYTCSKVIKTADDDKV